VADRAAEDLATIQDRFDQFAASFPDLTLYRRLAVGCARDPEVAGLLLAARPGQARPVLLFAAVHDLVLRRPELVLARWYSSVTAPEDLATGDAWPEFRRTVLEHRDELVPVIATRATQTNEVNRSVLVAVLLAAACSDVAATPVHLLELGSSAGLLLSPDRYRIDIAGAVVGDPASGVRVAGELRGSIEPDLTSFPSTIAERLGIDRDPVSIDDADRVRWLEACLWPDQPWRIDRFVAAVAIAATDPPRLRAGDMIELLPEILAASGSPGRPGAGAHVVIMNLWSLTYVDRALRRSVVDRLAEAAPRHHALSWITAEPPGCVPGIDPPPWNGERAGIVDEAGRPDTVLGVRRWRDGRELAPATLGWAHPHGNWIQLVDGAA